MKCIDADAVAFVAEHTTAVRPLFDDQEWKAFTANIEGYAFGDAQTALSVARTNLLRRRIRAHKSR